MAELQGCLGSPVFLLGCHKAISHSEHAKFSHQAPAGLDLAAPLKTCRQELLGAVRPLLFLLLNLSEEAG